ncbi:DNA-directed RNA polymerase sigma-70 factor [Microtetraspora sp. NBRC 13810]|uniref:RNA polymerase sigma factor n=1 Tax=Microtetraspora sp. NBRC 13810 TaxID=3030990 RepID=UPI0024A2F51C|nr:sigma-70 family RNA polymerase sigma factor [Microtetraspora sp. NBRC 13810]GLW10073.1 DNA-directed RNA polymerase sigma-70 factor [Microtetraspora sp. NBRC 13810]
MGADPHGRFVELYEHAYRPVLGYVLRRCQNPDDAADVVAETFTVAWRRIAEVPPGEEARLWLFGVARRVLANHRRGERRHDQRTAALREQLAASPLVTGPPREDLSPMGEVFRGLPDDDRELLALVAWERLDAGEIALMLGISRNAVRVRLFRARKRFARGLRRAGYDRTYAIALEGSTL